MDSLEAWSKKAAHSIGALFRQTYRYEGGQWYLYSGDEKMRPLECSELEWHLKRGHLPVEPEEGHVVDPSKVPAEVWFSEEPRE